MKILENPIEKRPRKFHFIRVDLRALLYVIIADYTLRAVRLEFDLKLQLFIGLHQLRVYHLWKENINLYNI